MRYTGMLLIGLVAGGGCDDDNPRVPPDASVDASMMADASNPVDAVADAPPSDAPPPDVLPPDAPPDAPPSTVQCAPDNGGITLPAGFCATVFADDVGKARQITVTPTGRVFVAITSSTPTAGDQHVLGLYDADNDGVAEQKQTFSNLGGNGIAWSNGQLFVAANDRIARFTMPDGTLTPTQATPVLVATSWPSRGDHGAKTVVASGDKLFVNVGSASNACQQANRRLHSPGIDPCPELTTRAGVWQIDANRVGQQQSAAIQVGTGLRNANALAIDPATQILWGAINGRDQLHENWPELFTAEQDMSLPAEEVVAISTGVDRGWPYCYYDAAAGQMKLAPEYGGDGTMQGRCATIAAPPIALDGHAAPLSMVFATGTQFPAAYRTGLFIANHGSRFDRNATGSLHGYDVEFARFENGQPTGQVEKFATGFDAGMRPLPDAAPHRPVGVAMMPDGSLLISDDKGGRIWRVFYRGP
jgi:glucose/arabinose dehydrogenase